MQSVITDIFFSPSATLDPGSWKQKFAFRLRFQIFCGFFAGKVENFAQVRLIIGGMKKLDNNTLSLVILQNRN